MAEKTLSFDTGLTEYKINDTVTVAFNPTDANFSDRFYETLSKLEEQQDAMRGEAEKRTDDPRAMFEFITERDKAMRNAIDSLLGPGVADGLFPNMNCYAMANGLPVWMNLMFAIADEIKTSIDAEQKKTDPRIQAYNKKYADLIAKYKPTTPDRQSQR